MSTNENRETALKMVEEISRGVLDESLVTDDVQWWIPGKGIVSKPEFLGIVKGFRSLLNGEVRMNVTGVTAENDRVAIEAEGHAALTNGKIYQNTYHFLFQFRNGKICLAKEYNDSRHAAEILGGALQHQD